MRPASMLLGTALVVGCCATLPDRLFAANSTDDQALSDKLIALERASWVAWQGHDAKFFINFLSDDHVELGSGGPTDKATVVAGVASPVCRVESYSVSDFRLIRLSEDSAVLLYRAEQKTTCGGTAVPSPVWATSVYALRAGQWKNILYGHIPLASALGKKKPL